MTAPPDPRLLVATSREQIIANAFRVPGLLTAELEIELAIRMQTLDAPGGKPRRVSEEKGWDVPRPQTPDHIARRRRAVLVALRESQTQAEIARALGTTLNVVRRDIITLRNQGEIR